MCPGRNSQWQDAETSKIQNIKGLSRISLLTSYMHQLSFTSQKLMAEKQ